MENTPIRILLADDDESDRLLFREAFEELEIKTTVRTVNNGIQLMEYLTVKEAILPDLIFLDLNMPRKNGLECLKEIRGDDKFSAVPIAIYSTSASEKDINETFLHGANIYIQKPNSFDALKQVLDKAVITTHLYQGPPFAMDNFLLRI